VLPHNLAFRQVLAVRSPRKGLQAQHNLSRSETGRSVPPPGHHGRDGLHWRPVFPQPLTCSDCKPRFAFSLFCRCSSYQVCLCRATRGTNGPNGSQLGMVGHCKEAPGVWMVHKKAPPCLAKVDGSPHYMRQSRKSPDSRQWGLELRSLVRNAFRPHCCLVQGWKSQN